MRTSLLLCGLVLLAACERGAPAGEAATLILRNGKVVTVDSAHPGGSGGRRARRHYPGRRHEPGD